MAKRKRHLRLVRDDEIAPTTAPLSNTSLPAGAMDPRREEIEAAQMAAWRKAGAKTR